MHGIEAASVSDDFPASAAQPTRHQHSLRRQLILTLLAAILPAIIAGIILTVEQTARHELVVALELALLLVAPVVVTAIVMVRRIERPMAHLIGIARAIMERREPPPEPASFGIAEFDELGQALIEAGRRVAAAARQDRERIEASEARFRAAQEGSLDGFIIYEPVCDANGTVIDFTILYLNPAAVRIGHSIPCLAERYANILLPEAVIGRRLSEIVPSSLGPDGFIARNAAIFATGQPVETVSTYEVCGVTRHFRRMLVPFGPALAVTFRDITGSLLQREALEAARLRAEKASAAKSRFLAAASHDLRQPLQAAVMFCFALSNLPTTDRQRDLVGNVQRALDSLQDMINVLLDISRLDAGVITPRLAAFDIGEVIDQICTELRLNCRGRPIELRSVPCGLRVYSDRTLIERIIRNLVTNALTYTEQGRVLVGCRRRGDLLQLQIWDTGIGIAPHQLKAIFEEFYQVAPPSRERRKGLGLGLAIVQRLSILLRHPVQVRSQPGKGSLFEIQLQVAPASPDEPAGETAPAGSSARPARTVVLLVENDRRVRDSVGLVLRQAGYQVASGPTVTAALAAASALETAPGLVVADCHVEGPSGTQAILHARAETGLPLPGILLTGDTSPARLKEATAGDFRLLHKPVAPIALIEAVSQALTEAKATALTEAKTTEMAMAKTTEMAMATDA